MWGDARREAVVSWYSPEPSGTERVLLSVRADSMFIIPVSTGWGLLLFLFLFANVFLFALALALALAPSLGISNSLSLAFPPSGKSKQLTPNPNCVALGAWSACLCQKLYVELGSRDGLDSRERR